MEIKTLLGHAHDLAEKATREGNAATKFLTPAESEIIRREYQNISHVTLKVEGGYDNPERIRMVFLNPLWGSIDKEELITAIRINKRPQDSIRHKDILGALMNLGIKRETIGDISANADPITFVCLPEISGYIVENLTRIGRVGVSLELMELSELHNREETIGIKTITVTSMRLDSLISRVFNISRNKSSEAISQGFASIDHIQCFKSDKEVDYGSIITVRGMGKARIYESEGITQKGRLRVKAGIYGIR